VADLERINRSHIVLLPKTAGAMSVGAFRPICLQNCDIKIASKAPDDTPTTPIVGTDRH
jgi:hypothetical protein